MSSHYILQETSPFSEFTAVLKTKDFDTNFDIETNDASDLHSYCQQLIYKTFSITNSQVPAFIKHHCDLAKDSLTWLNKFEKLIISNEELFHENKKDSKLTKFQTCIEFQRNLIKSEQSSQSPKRPSKKQINAETDKRYFCFAEIRLHLLTINNFEDKIIYLTNEKYDYQQSNIDFVNQNLPFFDKQCEREIEHLYEVKKIQDSMGITGIQSISNIQNISKIKINCPINKIVDVFYQLNRELFYNGKPYLDGLHSDFVQLICNNFCDKDGKEISPETMRTILSPSRTDKRPKTSTRIDIDKML